MEAHFDCASVDNIEIPQELLLDELPVCEPHGTHPPEEVLHLEHTGHVPVHALDHSHLPLISAQQRQDHTLSLLNFSDMNHLTIHSEGIFDMSDMVHSSKIE